MTQSAHGYVAEEKNVSYNETFFVNFWVIILCPVFLHQNLET